MTGTGRPKVTVRLDAVDLLAFKQACADQGLEAAVVLRAYARYHARIPGATKPPRPDAPPS
jgi:hypothetical protein